MAQFMGNSGQLIKIKYLWQNLTNEEISYFEGMRDAFFLAVRKKYGLPRAQAENLLRDMAHTPCEEAA